MFILYVTLKLTRPMVIPIHVSDTDELTAKRECLHKVTGDHQRDKFVFLIQSHVASLTQTDAMLPSYQSPDLSSVPL